MAINLSTLRNIMRNDSGIATDVVRLEQIVWILFLKIYDSIEENLEWTLEGKYTSIIPHEYKWRNWAPSKDENDKSKSGGLTGDALLKFIDELFKALAALPVTPNTPKGQARVRDVFKSGINNYSKNGKILRDVIDYINDNVDIEDAKERHAFGEIYEEMLRLLQAAGSAGEFYTPRTLTNFIVEKLDPKLGERFADFTSGTGGFLTSALNYMSRDGSTRTDDKAMQNYQNAVFGQEWKPLPYLLSIANLFIHRINNPNIINGDSLTLYKEDVKDNELFNVIGMNPPYGGSSDNDIVKTFPETMRSSETADLFIILIMSRLAKGGRAGVIIPDGFLFGTDGAKKAIKEKLLKDFNLHTIIRLPGSVFAPYTSIATNILFFNREKANGAPEGYSTKETWFYRLDMPDGYKHFSKTKPMTAEHCQPIDQWWTSRTEIPDLNADGETIGYKSKCYTVQQLIATNCNFDLCKFPNEEEEVLPPDELLAQYHRRRAQLDQKIDDVLGKIQGLLQNPTE